MRLRGEQVQSASGADGGRENSGGPGGESGHIVVPVRATSVLAPGEREVDTPSETSTKGGWEVPVVMRSLLTGLPAVFLPLPVTTPAQSCL